LKIVTLMLGSGNTANACDRGRSVEVSTGFTPHEGLVQSTRAGDMDAAIIPWLMREEGLDCDQVNELLNRKSGWLGLSGIGQDLRDVISAAEVGHERARLALGVQAHRARKYVGAYAAVMGGLDLLIFAGGVGLNSPLVRANICHGLEFLGLHLDATANAECRREAVISKADSPLPIITVEISEELVIARDTYEVVASL
jgi:acetate kinase